MDKGQKIEKVISMAVDSVNEMLDRGTKLGKSPDTVIFGAGGTLDSLQIINLISALEQNIKDEFGVDITLIEMDAFSGKESPFRTIDTLSRFISGKLG